MIPQQKSHRDQLFLIIFTMIQHYKKILTTTIKVHVHIIVGGSVQCLSVNIVYNEQLGRCVSVG